MHATKERTLRAAARARRDDAELAAVLGVAIEQVVVVERGDDARRRGHAPWWLAALVLLGAFVVVEVGWEQRCRRDEAQEPAALEPPEVTGCIYVAEHANDVEGWPRSLQGARFWRPDPTRPWSFERTSKRPCELAAVRPFDGLRFLAIFGDFDWTAEDTAAVAGLQALEQIELSVGEAFPSERFGVLAALPRLQFVTLQLARDLRATDIDALAKLPVLASLQVRGGRIDPAVVAALARLPRLRELVLADLDRCPEEALCALRYVPLLRRLQLEGMGAIPRTIPSVGDVDKRSVGLSIAVAKALAALPRLRSLTLTNVEVTAAAIDALPASLEQIGILASPQVGADVIASLARFPNLRRLDLDAGDRQASLGRLRFVAEFEEAIAKAYADAPPRDEVWHAQAELLRKVAPRELRWIGEMPAEIREAVAALPLTAIAFTRPRRTELELVRSLPGLRQVTLDSCELRRSDVELLAAVPNLLELHLRFVQTAIDEVREMLPKVRITTHGF